MAVYFECKYNAGATVFATVKRLSDGYYWNNSAAAFQAAPSLANKKITMTEGTSEYAGTYAGSVAAMGSPADVTCYFHDDGLTGDVPIGSVNTYVYNNSELSPADIISAAGTAWASGAITATAIAADAITAAKIANGAIDAATFAADVDAEILSYIVDDGTRIDASALNTASATTIPAILADTNELQVDWVNGGRLDLLIDGIKAKTDSLTFTVATKVDANITHVIGDAVQENGADDTEWGGTP